MLISTVVEVGFANTKVTPGGNDSLVVWLVFEIELNSPTTQSQRVVVLFFPCT